MISSNLRLFEEFKTCLKLSQFALFQFQNIHFSSRRNGSEDSNKTDTEKKKLKPTKSRLESKNSNNVQKNDSKSNQRLSSNHSFTKKILENETREESKSEQELDWLNELTNPKPVLQDYDYIEESVKNETKQKRLIIASIDKY